MSDGFFNYEEYSIQFLIEEMERLINENTRNYSENTIRQFQHTLDLLELTRVYIRRVDYLLSGDDNEEDFHARLKVALKKLEGILMFDKTYLNIPSIMPNNIHVEYAERRAPTDESVRLLKEMEDKTRERIIDSISIRDCQVDCQILKERDFISQGTRYLIVYSMNGKKSKVNLLVDDQDMNLSVAERLRDALAKDIATNMLIDSFDKVM